MCGIFGYAGPSCPAANLVFAGLKELEYRGYDSWGIAVDTNNHVATVKDIGKLRAAPTTLADSGLAIGHTRWATTGAVTHDNAHPHTDCTGRIALVHNGVVENYVELKAGLLQRGHHFASETDSEVIAHLLEEELGAHPAITLAEALRRVSLRLDGMNAVVAMDVARDELAAVKNGSPLVIGLNGGANYLASDIAALLQHTRRIIWVRDGQVASVSKDRVILVDAATGAAITPQVEEVAWDPQQAALGPYQHYLEKEIWEQPGLLRQIVAEGGAQADQLAGFLRAASDLYLTACGTAYHAALMSTYILADVGDRMAHSVYAHELAAFAPFMHAPQAVVALSQSGETIDVLDAVRAAHRSAVPVAALVNVSGSTLSREADYTLLLGAGPEKCVLSTKAFTAKVAYLMLAAGALGGRTAEMRAALSAAAAEMDAQRADGRLDTVRALAARIVDRAHLFVVGRGYCYPLALEAALKIKEVSYMHAEGFAAGELKHGVIALVEPGTPCLIFAPDGPDLAQALTTAGELKARGALIIGVGPQAHAVFDVHLRVQATGHAFPLAALPPVQLLAYHLALLRGHDPDKPRNLAKSVTVR
ncbi:MAG TPA: glutamine--fructose-6-phosphate transaminase (isomerizing) [Chloroflexia bacterium]|nr:glutamine--fructose-6-phosphate transaminase (isomerizing) [Chloroflexia bacterium]